MSETETVRKSARDLGFDPELVLPALNFWLERARAADRLGVDGETWTFWIGYENNQPLSHVYRNRGCLRAERLMIASSSG